MLSLIYNIVSDHLVTKSEDPVLSPSSPWLLEHFVLLIFLWNSFPFLAGCCHSLQSPCSSNTPAQIHSLVPPLYKDLSQARDSGLPSLCLCTMVASLGDLRLLKHSLSALSCALAESYTHYRKRPLLSLHEVSACSPHRVLHGCVGTEGHLSLVHRKVPDQLAQSLVFPASVMSFHSSLKTAFS